MNERFGSAERVDLNTGERTPIENGGFRMLPAAKGNCEICGVKHLPDEPHNKQSVFYQINFKQLHGREATWTDAMAHCSNDAKLLWRQELVKMMKKHGMEIPEDLREE